MEPRTLVEPVGVGASASTIAAASASPAAQIAHAAGALAGGGAGLGPVLTRIAADAAAALGAERCAVYLRDAEGGDFVGAAAHEGDAASWIASARIPAQSPGLARLVRDGGAAELRLPASARGRSGGAVELRRSLVVAVPVGAGCGGLMVVDRARARATAPKDPERRELAFVFAALAGAAALAARHDETVRTQLRVLGRRLRLERGICAVEDQLLDLDPATATPADVGRLLAAGLALPCAVVAPAAAPLAPAVVLAFDAGGQPAARPALLRSGTLDRPEIAAALAAVDASRPRILGPYPHLGVHVRHVVARAPEALIVAGEAGRALRSDDLRLVRRAAAVLATAQRVQRRLAEAERRDRASLVRDAVHGSDEPDRLRRRAAALGLDLDAPSVVCLLSAARGSLDCDDLGPMGAPIATYRASTSEGVVLVAPLDSLRSRRAALDTLRDELQELVDALRRDDREVVAAVSSACRSARDLPAALEECRQLRGGPTDVVRCADDLGVGKLLLGRITPAAADRCLEETFGSIADPEERAKLLETLDAFFAANRFVRATAAGLGIHENTVRHRFRRLANATGLDVLGSIDDQLVARLALTMHRLRPIVPATKEHA